MNVTDAKTRILLYTDDLTLQFFSDETKEIVEFYFLNNDPFTAFNSAGTTAVVNPNRCVAAEIDEVG